MNKKELYDDAFCGMCPKGPWFMVVIGSDGVIKISP